MDIWAWMYTAYPELIEQGHNRLASIINDLPSLVLDDEIAKVDALVPEALALCKQQKNPWIEIFIRHWNLQSRVLCRGEGEGQLQEVISLLDYASQETTKDCPQSICIVQDLSICYAHIDYIGYADERLAVSQETLSRIDPSWNCYPCIVSEFLNAKSDKKLYQEVLEEIQYHKKQMKLANPSSTEQKLILREVLTLESLKRYQDAFDLLKTANNPNGGMHFKNKCKLIRGRLYARLGDYNNALKNLLPFNKIFSVLSLAPNWCDLCYMLAKAEIINNDESLNHSFEQLCQKWLDLGCLRVSFENTVLQTKLAIKRQQTDTVKGCLKRLNFILPKLKIDGGAAEKIAKLEDELALI